MQALDFLYIVQGAHLGNIVVPGFGSKRDDDVGQERFKNVMRYAHRIRLVGYGKIEWKRRAIQSAQKYLEAGPECALRVLEVQPILWGQQLVARRIAENLGSLVTHPQVAEQLEFRLIRDTEEEGENLELDNIQHWLNGYQRLDPVSRKSKVECLLFQSLVGYEITTEAIISSKKTGRHVQPLISAEQRVWEPSKLRVELDCSKL